MSINLFFGTRTFSFLEAASPFLVESPHPPLVAAQPVSAPFRTMKEPAAKTLVPDQSR